MVRVLSQIPPRADGLQPSELIEQGLTGGEDVAVGGFEVAGVPGVGHVTGFSRPRHHQRDLPGGIFRNDASQQPKIGGVHTDNPVEQVIVRTRHLPRAAGEVERHPMPRQAPLRRRIERIPDLFARHRRRLHRHRPRSQRAREFAFPHQLPHNELRHRTATNVAVAEEEDFHDAMLLAKTTLFVFLHACRQSIQFLKSRIGPRRTLICRKKEFVNAIH